jgi:hypothetical protein
MGKMTWRKAGVYVLVALPVLGLAAIAVVAQQQQDPDPVAEAARKAREKKKEEPKPKKVYTNDDIASAPPPPVAANATPNADAKDGAAAADGADKGPGASKDGETAWRKRFRDAREKLAQSEQELDILQREQQKAQVQYYADPQKALSEQYTRKDVNEKDTKIEAKKQEVEQMKQHIADLEDELRKSGGDSGWAR